MESINCSVIATWLDLVIPDFTCPTRIASIEHAGIQVPEDIALVGFDDLMNDRQAQSGAIALGGKVGIKNSLKVGHGDTSTRVH